MKTSKIKCSNQNKTNPWLSWISVEVTSITVYAVLGVEMARSYFRHNYGTREAVVVMLSEKSNWRKFREDESSDARHSDGLHCSSYEAFVMKVEQRMQPILNLTTYQREIG
jgi:hypothetical protein